MTTSDKTGDKLVQSIRKTKAGASPATPKPRTTTTRKKAPARAAAKPRTTAKAKTTTDPYQSGRRVWPD